MEHLYDDILSNITRYVDEYSIVLMLICKRWNTIATTYNTLHKKQNGVTGKILGVICYNGQTNLLEWFKTTFERIVYFQDYLEHFLEEAIRGGHINTIEWLLREDSGIEVFISHFASKHGKLPILEWLLEYDYDCDIFGCVCMAARYGHLEIIQYLEMVKPANKKIKYNFVCNHAAAGNQLSILKWLRQQNYPWDKWTSLEAAINSNLECLVWILANGCPWNENILLYRKKHHDIMRWLDENGYDYNEG